MASATPGPRDHLVTRALERALTELDAEVLDEHLLDPAEAPDRLARHAMDELRRGLDSDESADIQAERVNAILRSFAGGEAATPRSLCQRGCSRASRAARRSATCSRSRRCRRRRSARATCSSTPRASRTSAPSCEPSSRRADSVDLICAFVIWSGVRHLRDALADVVGARRPSPRDHDDVHGRDGEARGRRAGRARRRGPRRVRRAHDEAPREGVAARARLRAEHRVRRLVEPLAHGALRRAGVERAAVVDRCRRT